MWSQGSSPHSCLWASSEGSRDSLLLSVYPCTPTKETKDPSHTIGRKYKQEKGRMHTGNVPG